MPRPPRLAAALVAALVAALAACTVNENANGTLRDEQRVLFETSLWQDARCTLARAENCCARSGPFCLDFTEIDVADVRVSGQRVVVLVTRNNGHALAISDDRGGSWRTVPVGSIGGIAQVRPTALHLSESEVYLMVAEQEQGAGGGATTRVRPVRVDLATGATSPVASDWFLVGRVPAFTRDGASIGVSFSPEDERGGGTCVALEETWRPGASPTRRTATMQGSCTSGLSVVASNDGRFFPYLSDADGGPACVLQYDAATGSATRTCVPLAEWPARSEPRVLASYADERAEYLRAFAVRGNAFVASPSLATPIPLGPGVPRPERALSGRSRYAGFVVLGDADNGPGRTLVRVPREGAAEEVILPRGPCAEDPARSCFDPANPSIPHGEYGDALWIEPLGGDEFLVFWLHDRAPGINQYQGVLSVSRERATYRARQGLTPFESLGPPGHPTATRAGPIEEVCVRRQTCTPAREDFHQCVNGMLQETPSTPRLQSALDAARSASCSDPIYTEPAWLGCLIRGGAPRLEDNGQGQRFFLCEEGGATPTPCPAGRGLNPVCVGDVGERCLSGRYTRTRCDLLNMACDATSQTAGWRPCVARQIGPPLLAPDAMRCDGRYLLWNINGTHWADCRALGFGQCVGRRCEM